VCDRSEFRHEPLSDVESPVPPPRTAVNRAPHVREVSGHFGWRRACEYRLSWQHDDVPVPIQIVIDCRDPNALADFWAEALGYAKQWDCTATPAWCAVVDRTKRGPRIVFQRVDEARLGKNRVHLDMQVGQDYAEAEVKRLLTIGAATLETIEVAGPPLHTRTIMRDPEGNEFCVQ